MKGKGEGRVGGGVCETVGRDEFGLSFPLLLPKLYHITSIRGTGTCYYRCKSPSMSISHSLPLETQCFRCKLLRKHLNPVLN